ncbi:uncharacterized protein BJX67DRAFT_294556 [Aspergillus lucknowensis]|uniref:Uncharacterized protein n=1 Tax=Aspergillus lucknowensis TaxID=176173 RepID=A0ABR4LEZ4_9EURO
MAEFKHPVRPGFSHKPAAFSEPHRPYWARSQVQYAQDLLDYSPDPIEYDIDDQDYWDNHFFFPEDCSWSPPKGWELDEDNSEEDIAVGECYDHHDVEDDTMIPGLPDIKMLDAEALSDLLEDNLSPPEITSIFVFATNGAIFAYASSLPSRQLRNLSATYGAAYTCYAKTASSGNLTGVNPASHPSSYVTAQSVSLGDVGSIVFELDDLVAVVTRIADKVLLAAVGPSKVKNVAPEEPGNLHHSRDSNSNVAIPLEGSAASSVDLSKSASTPQLQTHAPANGTTNANGDNTSSTPTSAPASTSASTAQCEYMTEAQLETQYEVDRSRDLERLASLNLSTPPAILLALESKSAALGRFLSQKLEDLESPEDF